MPRWGRLRPALRPGHLTRAHTTAAPRRACSARSLWQPSRTASPTWLPPPVRALGEPCSARAARTCPGRPGSPRLPAGRPPRPGWRRPPRPPAPRPPAAPRLAPPHRGPRRAAAQRAPRSCPQPGRACARVARGRRACGAAHGKSGCVACHGGVWAEAWAGLQGHCTHVHTGQLVWHWLTRAGM